MLEYYGTQRPSFAGNGGAGSNFSVGKSLGYTGADANFSSYMSSKKFPVDYFETDEEEEEMEDNILEKRVLNNGTYSLEETLANVNEEYEYLDQFATGMKYAARTGLKGVKVAGKSATMAIPFVDAIAGSIYLTSGALEFRKITNEIVEHLNTDENSFAEAIASDDESKWQAILGQIAATHPEDRAAMESSFEDLLENIKSFIVTLFQAYDSYTGVGVAANPITALGGFLAEMAPIEQVLFQLYTKYAEGVEKLFSYFVSSGKSNETQEKGGPIFSAILFSPARTIRRLGNFYEAVASKAPPIHRMASGALDKFAAGDYPDLSGMMQDQDVMKMVAESYIKTDEEAFEQGSLSVFVHENVTPRLRGQNDRAAYASGIFEELEEDEADDIDEMSAGGVAGVGMKLGHNPDGTPTTKDQLKDLRSKQDIYRITENQTWNHKTLGRIKF